MDTEFTGNPEENAYEGYEYDYTENPEGEYPPQEEQYTAPYFA
jgi:hypothetical protein